MAAPLAPLDPSDSPLAFFGSELRRLRTEAARSQEAFGKQVYVTGAYVGLVEAAKRSPSQDFAERCDSALGTDGIFVRLWPLVNRQNFPSWFQGFVELEQAATKLAT